MPKIPDGDPEYPFIPNDFDPMPYEDRARMWIQFCKDMLKADFGPWERIFFVLAVAAVYALLAIADQIRGLRIDQMGGKYDA